MLTIIIALLLDVVVFIILVIFRVGQNTINIVFKDILIGGIIIGLFAPISGFESEELKKEVQIGSYIEQNIIWFKYMEKTEPIILPESGETEEYKEKTVFLSKLTIYMEDCKKPILKVYKKRIKKSKWTFALLPCIEEYEIHIPLPPEKKNN